MMMPSSREEAERLIDEHERTVDALHHKLAGIQGADKHKLQKVFEAHKAAHRKFKDDALGCMN